MALSDEDNLKKLEAALKKSNLSANQIPNKLKILESQLRAAKLQKDMKKKSEEAFDKGVLGATIKIVADSKEILKFFAEAQKTSAEMRLPSMPAFRMSELKPSTSLEVFVQAVSIAQVVLIAVQRKRRQIQIRK